MIELSKHIETLLLEHNCVIVPDLGGFVAQDCSAEFVEEEKVFLPPYRTVAFNPLLQINDGLLAQSYMKAGGRTYAETLRTIATAVAELKRSIEDNNGAELNGIGKLRLGTNGQYDFTPVAGGIVAPALYGLDAVTSKPVASKKGIGKRTGRKNEKISDYYTLRVRKTTFHSFAAAVVGMIFYFWAVPLNNSSRTSRMEAQMFEQMAKVIEPSTQAEPEITPSNVSLPIATVPAAITVVEASSNTKTSAVTIGKSNAPTTEAGIKHTAASPKATSSPLEEEPQPKAEPQSQHGYVIVLASQVSLKGAQTFVRQLADNGFTEAGIHRHKNITRVVYGNFASSQAAQSKLRKLRGTHRVFQEAWILKV